MHKITIAYYIEEENTNSDIYISIMIIYQVIIGRHLKSSEETCVTKEKKEIIDLSSQVWYPAKVLNNL